MNEPLHLLQNYRLFDVPAVKHKKSRVAPWACEASKIKKRSGDVKTFSYLNGHKLVPNAVLDRSQKLRVALDEWSAAPARPEPASTVGRERRRTRGAG
jgi:hypothetical protein